MPELVKPNSEKQSTTFKVWIYSVSKKRYRVETCYTMADVVRLTYELNTNWEVRVKTHIVLTDSYFGDDLQDPKYFEQYKHAIRSMKSKGYIS